MASGNITRRGFLGAAGGVALAAGTGASGAALALAEEADEATATTTTVAQPSFMTPPDPVSEDDISETLACDVLVIGAGVAGMSVARAAAEGGAGVIVVEKAEHPLCRGNFGSQFGAIGSSYQQGHGLEVDGRALVERYQRDTLQMSNQFFIQYWADHSGETLDWCLAACPDVVEFDVDGRDLESLADGQVGVCGYSVEDGYDPSVERYPAFNTKLSIGSNNTELNEGGFSLMLEYFQQIVEQAGGQFLFSTFGRYLEKDDDGAVTGAVVQAQDGTWRRINATNTVLACGDFASDQEMRDYYTPQASNLTCLYNGSDCNGDVCNTGDGHKMALWAGAHMEPGPYAPMAHLSSTSDVLIVDAYGERVCNEDLGAQSITNVIMRLPGQKAYVISGSSRGAVVLDPGPFGVTPEEAFDDFELLAQQIGDACDPEVLRATVERYNEMCDAGEDTQYGKDARYMTKLDAPYWVTPSGPGNLLVIMGGIACTNGCQALGADDAPIPGLYVVGNNQGGRFGAEYPMTAPGISHGIAFTLGRYLGDRLAAGL